MAGALAERVFAEKLGRTGFADVWVGGHRPTSIDEASQYPLFTDEVIEQMRRALPSEQHDHVATSVIVKARKPESTMSRTRSRSLDEPDESMAFDHGKVDWVVIADQAVGRTIHEPGWRRRDRRRTGSGLYVRRFEASTSSEGSTVFGDCCRRGSELTPGGSRDVSVRTDPEGNETEALFDAGRSRWRGGP